MDGCVLMLCFIAGWMNLKHGLIVTGYVYLHCLLTCGRGFDWGVHGRV